MKKKVILKQICLKVILVLIAFFSLNIDVNASSFAYDSFDWDEFYEENVGYWTDYCTEYSGEISLDECLEVTLSGKKNYYEKLYKLLAKYEGKGYKLKDNYLIATTFFYLTPDTFSDLPDEYLEEYKTGEAYGIDGDIESYDVETDLTESEYLAGEVNDLKMLTKHMFSYHASCENANGEVIENYSLTYTEYLTSKWGFLKFFGLENKYEEECINQGGDYKNSDGTKKIDYDMYWKFLEESEYFDEKVHLSYFYRDILEKTNHNYMSELTDSEKEEYEEALIEARKDIVAEIKSIIDTYGEGANTPNSFTSAGCSTSAWWPIGSDETTNKGDILFASGNPISTSVTSKFGPRIHPLKGTLSQHTGIDIGGVSEGVTNVVAVKDGVVVYPTEGSPTNCPSSNTLDSCGGGYGNYVIIQHNDGTYSLYAHLYANSITVTANDSVKQGQVIGKIGSSGNSTGPHLHFEIRQGNNSSASTVNPLNYISAENPRSGGFCGSSNSEFTKMLNWFEGGCDATVNGNNYVAVDDGVGIPTVGYGIALKHNIDGFKKYGIDVTNMTFGDEISIEIVEKVKEEKVGSFRTYVQNYLAEYSITLHDYQIDCLTMVSYQFGNIGNFGNMYNEHGNTENLRELTYSISKGNPSWYFFKENPSTGNGRADATWKLFHEGVYTYKSSVC